MSYINILSTSTSINIQRIGQSRFVAPTGIIPLRKAHLTKLRRWFGAHFGVTSLIIFIFSQNLRFEVIKKKPFLLPNFLAFQTWKSHPPSWEDSISRKKHPSFGRLVEVTFRKVAFSSDLWPGSWDWRTHRVGSRVWIQSLDCSQKTMKHMEVAYTTNSCNMK